MSNEDYDRKKCYVVTLTCYLKIYVTLSSYTRKLSKDEVIDLLPDYQNKFVTTLTRIKIDLSDL